MSTEDPRITKKVDEAWKERVEKERQEPVSDPGQAAPVGGQAAPASKPQVSDQPQPESPRSKAEPRKRAESAQQKEPAHTEFTFFLSTLSMQAMIALGDVPHPATNQAQLDLEQARYMVDVLAMLQQKTNGNLTPEESELLQSVLYELRMRYVARLNEIQQAGGPQP